MPQDGDHELQHLHASPALEEETERNTMPSTIEDRAEEHNYVRNARDDDREALLARSQMTPRSLEKHSLNRHTVRKLDCILLPFLALLFLLNSLDKSNIGNAETAGFTKDTGLSRQDVNTSMSCFFFVFVLLQPVGAALGRKFGMARYVPVCMSLWGLSTLLHIFVRSRWQLIVLRITIAALESGFYPTTVSYLSLFYTKFEFAVRLGFFYGMTAVSGVLGGILSWAVFSRFPGYEHGNPSPPPPRATGNNVGGWKSWEILFLIEGCTTMTVALIGFLWLPQSANSAWFFTADEKSWAEQRIHLDTEAQSDAHSEASRHRRAYEASGLAQGGNLDEDDHRGEAHDHLLENSEDGFAKTSRPRSTASVTADSGLARQDVLSAILNYKIWHLLLVNILSAIPATAFGVLLPIIVKDMSPSLSLSPAASNLLSAPPFAFGAVVLFLFTYWSDKTRQRLVPILWGLGLLLIGLMMAVLAPVDSYWLRYASLCILLSGSFIASPLTVAWLANNTPQPGKRAILLGINGWGNFAGVFLVVLFTPEDEKNGYARPFVILLSCVVASFAGFIAFWILLVRENKWRDDITSGWSEEDRRREEVCGDMVVPESLVHKLAEHVGVYQLARWLRWEEERNGDEKLTFRYSL